MIEKKYRLKEREVKKVLQKGKPFFSYNLVLNLGKSRLDYSRFAIVISGKSSPNAVVRNIYRRSFYNFMKKEISIPGRDVVCVIKSKTKCQEEVFSCKEMHSEIRYLLNKKIWKSF